MIVRNDLIQGERIEKPPLVLIEPSHHCSPPPMSQRRNHRSPRAARDFCNKICHKLTLALQTHNGQSAPSSRTAEAGSISIAAVCLPCNRATAPKTFYSRLWEEGVVSQERGRK